MLPSSDLWRLFQVKDGQSWCQVTEVSNKEEIVETFQDVNFIRRAGALPDFGQVYKI